VDQFQIKSKKGKVRQRSFTYLVFSDDDNQKLLHKRTQKGIWHNLYEFPVIETEEITTDENVLVLIQNQNFVNNTIREIGLYNPEAIVHKLSHQHLNIKFWKIKVNGKLENGMNWKSAKKMPFPIVIFNFIEKYSF